MRGSFCIPAVLFLAGLGSQWIPVRCLDNGLALTPPMGWNSWNAFRRDYDEVAISAQIDKIVEYELREAGYTYVNVDGAWWNGDYENGIVYRNESTGRFVDPTDKFPNGVKTLSDKAHSKGLKFGWYTSGREAACCCGAEGFEVMKPMSGGNEEIDLELFLEWGIDYLKVDNCGTSKGGGKFSGSSKIMRTWADLLKGTGVVLSNSRFDCMSKKGKNYFSKPPDDDPFQNTYSNKLKTKSFCTKYSNLWRVSIDIRDAWWSVLFNSRAMIGRGKSSGPGHWNDPDMLMVGNGGLNFYENQAHFSLWCVLSAPLLIGVDLRKHSKYSEIVKILGNRAAIAVNQEYDDHAGDRFRVSDDQYKVEEWVKLLGNSELALVVLNAEYEGKVTDYEVELHYKEYAEHLLGSKCFKKIKKKLDEASIRCDVYNIWEDNSSTETNTIVLTLEEHQCSFLRISNCYVENTDEDTCKQQ
mmetsp:Transcript_1174/g.1751  ORF Transcript_1174/g.1751 Transcript_1174/m.1751 type:complete len:469 (+) Transcript_1174:187-1593(+)|eukprot:CAMPEP_0204824412 /NCGR_PEP_ID=MMETSP1346-20131115/2437_1 /ASSEMBLY_ACC=CAM_ASM_000771 /TAXON_ID=215587 /ORGANISM="Aplanochytrium stocchinoi, Strain GSBS06" /LENGTH=468 /DNA_ID=CAMNT_0051951557 /DNA_START=286 /DNA_END=1692 /DNA_ORIENTATION=+